MSCSGVLSLTCTSFMPSFNLFAFATTRDLHERVPARLIKLMGFDSVQAEDGNRWRYGTLG